MPKPLTIKLTAKQRRELEDTRDHHQKPYMRERAAAILKIADGASGLQVGRSGLLKQRDPDSVYSWFHRYEDEGLGGLVIRKGRGRKPAFSPKHATGEKARDALLNVVRREPRFFGYCRSRWTLPMIRQTCDWLRVTTVGGLSQLLHRLGIGYKQARSYVHSPDRHYEDKVSLTQLCLLKAWYAPERYVFVYQDELTYYRQPTLARAYECRGHTQPLAHRSYRSNTQFRIVAALNAITGQVTYRQHYKIHRTNLSDFYAALRADYPNAEEIYLTQDNWPVHFHPDVLARLQPQTFYPAPPRVPSNWPTKPGKTAVQDDLPIRLLLLPTYASWLNPIEKPWRKLKQDVLHLHRLSDDWQALKTRVAEFLDQFSRGSPQLIKYAGLLPS